MKNRWGICLACVLPWILCLPAHAASPWDSLKKVAVRKPAAKAKKGGTAVAGVRGLNEGEDRSDPNARDFKAVERMESVSVSEGDVGKFLAEGGVKAR